MDANQESLMKSLRAIFVSTVILAFIASSSAAGAQETTQAPKAGESPSAAQPSKAGRE